MKSIILPLIVALWNLGIEEPHVYLSRYDAYGQRASYVTLADGQRALKVDLTSSLLEQWEGWFRSYRLMPEFSKGRLSIRYWVPEGAPRGEFSVILCNRVNERFPLRVEVDGSPGWHTASFDLDAELKHQPGFRNGLPAKIGSRMIDTVGELGYYDQPMRVIGLTGKFSSLGESSWLGFGPITFEAQSLERAIRPVLETGTAFHALVKGRESSLGLSLHNATPQPYEGNVEWQLSDAFGYVLGAGRREMSLKPGEKQTFPFVEDLKRYGNYYVDIVSSSPGKASCSVRKSFCYIDPVGATPGRQANGFLFSIDTHFPLWRIDAETEAEAIALIGAKIIRENSSWHDSRPDPKYPLSHARTHDPLEPFEALGIEFQPTLLYTPKWAVAKDTKSIYKGQGAFQKMRPDYGLWREYVREYFKETKGRFRYYEVWNEADIHFADFTWEEYIQLQRIAYAELKAIDPSAKLLTNGYSSLVPCKQDPDHLLKTMKDVDSYDIFAFHGHNFYPNYKAMIGNLTEMLAEHAPGKPWYANETAYHSGEVGELEQAIQLFKKLVLTWAKGAMGYTWYDFRNDGFDLLYGEHNYGMVTRDFHPKAVYPVFNTLAKHLTDAEFVDTLRDEDDCEAYLFRRKDGRYIVATWNSDPVPRKLIVRNGGTAPNSIDMFGNMAPLESNPKGDGHWVSVNAFPVFVSCGSSKPELGQLLKGEAVELPMGAVPLGKDKRSGKSLAHCAVSDSKNDGLAYLRLSREGIDGSILRVQVDVLDQVHDDKDAVKVSLVDLPGLTGDWVLELALTGQGEEMRCLGTPVGFPLYEYFRHRISPLASGGIRYELWLPVGALGFDVYRGRLGFGVRCALSDNGVEAESFVRVCFE